MKLNAFSLLLSFLAVICDQLVQPRFGCGEEATPAKVSYSKEIEPLLRTHCQGCHQPAKAQGDLTLTDYAHLLKRGRAVLKLAVL